MSWEDHRDYPEIEHVGRLLSGDPKAVAWEWIRAYCENLSSDGDPEDGYGSGIVTPEELIEIALTHVESEDRWGGDYLNKGPLLDGVSLDPTFWDKLAALKDLEIPNDKRNNFFSCSC
jgi:hypothetical protein